MEEIVIELESYLAIESMRWTIPLLLFGYFATDALSKINGGVMYMSFALTAAFIVLFVVKAFARKRQEEEQVSLRQS